MVQPGGPLLKSLPSLLLLSSIKRDLLECIFNERSDEAAEAAWKTVKLRHSDVMLWLVETMRSYSICGSSDVAFLQRH